MMQWRELDTRERKTQGRGLHKREVFAWEGKRQGEEDVRERVNLKVEEDASREITQGSGDDARERKDTSLRERMIHWMTQGRG